MDGRENCDNVRSDHDFIVRELLRGQLLIDLLLEGGLFYPPNVRHLSFLGSSSSVICLEHHWLIESGHPHSLMLFFSFCNLTHAPPPVVDAWFRAPSFAFSVQAFFFKPCLSKAQHDFDFNIDFLHPFFTLLLCSNFSEHSVYLCRLLLLHFVLFEQLGCFSDNFCYSRSPSLLELGYFALHHCW